MRNFYTKRLKIVEKGRIIRTYTCCETSYEALMRVIENFKAEHKRKEKKNLILQRNAILDTTLMKFLPRFKRKIAEIDRRLDGLDLKIYEKESKPHYLEIETILLNIKNELKEFKSGRLK